MNNKYDISVIVPIYNAEKHIKECIDSIANQSFEAERIQVILVDDGSTDGSYDICKEYSVNRSNVILITQNNSGVSAARNNGIRNAMGKYIMFVD